MNPFDTTLLVVRVCTLGVLVTLLAIVSRRAVKVASTELRVLSTYLVLLIAFIVAMMLRALSIPVPFMLGIGLYQACALSLYVFLHVVFYTSRPSPFKWIVPVAATIAGLLVMVGLARDVTPVTSADYIILRVLHATLNALQAWFGASIQGVLCLRAYLRYRSTRGVSLHVASRYMFMLVMAIVGGVGHLVEFIGTWLDIAGHLDLRLTRMLTSAFMLCYAFSMTMAWAMPAWFQRALDSWSRFQTSLDADRALTSRQVNAIVDYLGEVLAPLVNQSPSATKGFLLVALSSEPRHASKPYLDLAGIRRFLVTTLKEKMIHVGITGVDDIVSRLERTLVDEQSLLFMLSL